MFWLRLFWLELFSIFLKILSISAVGWDLRISWACLRVSSAAWPAPCTSCFGQSEVAFLKKSFTKGTTSLVPHTIISLIRESWRLSNSHLELNFLVQSQNHESFDPLGACMWNTCGKKWFCFSYGRTGVNFISSPGSNAPILLEQFQNRFGFEIEHGKTCPFPF